MKPNNKLSHVHQQSNHALALIKNIPLNINKRLTNISSSKEVFDESIATYQQALKESGYDHKLTYNPEGSFKNEALETRKRSTLSQKRNTQNSKTKHPKTQNRSVVYKHETNANTAGIKHDNESNSPVPHHRAWSQAITLGQILPGSDHAVS